MSATTAGAPAGAVGARRRAAGHPFATPRAIARSMVFMLKMLPLPQRPWDRLTPSPHVVPRWMLARSGRGEGDLYRPAASGRRPGVVCALGIVPAGVEHPMVRLLGEGLARAGFVALLYRSTTMRDLRLDPADVGDLAAAYETLLREPYVEAGRSGLLGVCVGASFALMAAASASIRDEVSFVFAYAPYSSMWTLAVDIASGTRGLGDVRERWDVDPLTWKSYVRSVTDWLPRSEAQTLRDAYEGRISWNADKTVILHAPAGPADPATLSSDGRSALRLLAAGADDVDAALRELPPLARERMTAMSPMSYVHEIAAPRIMLLHDRYDHVIPVGESRRLAAALAGRPGVTYTELGLRHLRMPQGLSPLPLVREIVRTYLAWYPLFRETTA